MDLILAGFCNTATPTYGLQVIQDEKGSILGGFFISYGTGSCTWLMSARILMP